jgi:hypothetical protein
MRSQFALILEACAILHGAEITCGVDTKARTALVEAPNETTGPQPTSVWRLPRAGAALGLISNWTRWRYPLAVFCSSPAYTGTLLNTHSPWVALLPA